MPSSRERWGTGSLWETAGFSEHSSIPKVTANCDSWVGGPDWGKCHLEREHQWEEKDAAAAWRDPSAIPEWQLRESVPVQPLGQALLRAVTSKQALAETFPMAQRLSLQDPTAGGLGWIPGQGTRSHMPQLRVLMLQWRSKIPCAASKTRFGQIK